MGISTSKDGRRWTLAILAFVCVHMVVSVFVPRGFFLTSFGDILQNAVLFAAAIAFLANIRTDSPKPRLFWALMGLGLTFWLVSQVMWTFFEVVLRHEAPNPFVGDVILFLHVVPMMAAVAVQPHLQQDLHQEQRNGDVVLHRRKLHPRCPISWASCGGVTARAAIGEP